MDDFIDIHFEYPLLNEVMRVLKQFDEVKWTQNFTESCYMRLQIRRSLAPRLEERLSSIHGVEVKLA